MAASRVLLRWLERSEPDIIYLQEVKAPDDRFPQEALHKAGYQAIWHGQKSWNGVAILSRVGEIHETRRQLPGNPDDTQSRYIEAAVNGMLIAGLSSKCSPRPGPKFDPSSAGSNVWNGIWLRLSSSILRRFASAIST